MTNKMTKKNEQESNESFQPAEIGGEKVNMEELSPFARGVLEGVARILRKGREHPTAIYLKAAGHVGTMPIPKGVPMEAVAEIVAKTGATEICFVTAAWASRQTEVAPSEDPDALNICMVKWADMSREGVFVAQYDLQDDKVVNVRDFATQPGGRGGIDVVVDAMRRTLNDPAFG